MGRWLSPDWSASPEPVPYAQLVNPQTLNLYGYVKNNPTTLSDFDGHIPISPEKDVVGSANRVGDGTEPGFVFGVNAITTATDAFLAEAQTAAVQVVQDTVVGGAKEVANTVIDLSNAVNKPIDALLSNFTRFQFGQIPEFQGSTTGEKSAMAGVFIASFFTGVGEEKTLTKITSLTSDAEKAYPKLAGAGGPPFPTRGAPSLRSKGGKCLTVRA